MKEDGNEKEKAGEEAFLLSPTSSSSFDERLKLVEDALMEEANLRYDELGKAQQDLQVRMYMISYFRLSPWH